MEKTMQMMYDNFAVDDPAFIVAHLSAEFIIKRTSMPRFNART
jgi:hypothetical protein